MVDKETKKRITDLLYVQKEIYSRIYTDIGDILRGKGRDNKAIKESIIYVLDDRLN